MDCSKFQSHIDEFLDGDGDLPYDQQKSMLEHQAQCSTCKARMMEAQRIQKLLHDLPVPEPRAGFHDRVLAVATERSRDKRSRSFTSGFASAIAAGLMIWIVVGLFNGEKTTNVSNPIPGVNIALNDTRNVKVTFSSQRALKDATISLIIPENVELAGYPGQHELKWKTNLSPGSNYLRLPILAVKAIDGQLIVKIEHQNKTKTLRLNLRITQPGLTQIPTELLGA